ncbi:MAG: cytochrome c family protein, partial [Deltaproteobacteria bacterium]
MKTSRWITLALTVLLTAGLVASCGTDKAKIDEVITGPKTYVGSEQCKVCHLEHYDSWKMTLHSRTLQDVTQNRDALITDIDPEAIRTSLKKAKKNLKVPVDKIYIPKVEEIKYTIGIQWNQRF